MQKAFLVLGAALLLIGAFWPWLKKLPLGRLPGDFIYRGENTTFYFPLMTMIIVSLILSLVFRFFR